MINNLFLVCVQLELVEVAACLGIAKGGGSTEVAEGFLLVARHVEGYTEGVLGAFV